MHNYVEEIMKIAKIFLVRSDGKLKQRTEKWLPGAEGWGSTER